MISKLERIDLEMEINKGNIFYRYSDRILDDEIQEVELYVALNTTVRKDDTVILMNLEDFNDMWEIENHELLGTDLVLLEPHYHVEVTKSSPALMMDGHSMVRIIPDAKKISSKTNLTQVLLPMKVKDTDSVYMYNFLSYDQIKEIISKCFPITTVEPIGQENKVNEFLSVLLYDINVKSLNAKELKHTFVTNNHVIEIDFPDYTQNNTHLKEIEDAVRIHMNENYICVPYTPAYDSDVINKPHVIIAPEKDRRFYLVLYSPIESYLKRGLREDPEVQDICNFLAQNM